VSVATREEVERFLRETEPSGYMAVPLPHGLALPGQGRSKNVEHVFSGGVSGKRVLDVGTYYGFYPIEAMERGAAEAVGVEMDEGRYKTAQRISELWGGRHRIERGRVEELAPTGKFDLVLFLNVLHHVTDPIAVVRTLAALSRERVVIEFCLPSDPALLVYAGGDTESPSVYEKLRARVYSALVRALPSSIPLMAVGPRAYHRTFFFTPSAFSNLFVRQLGLFERVTYHRGGTAAHRVLALCDVPRSA
jgi:SAM-dependent methyltransferase